MFFFYPFAENLESEEVRGVQQLERFSKILNLSYNTSFTIVVALVIFVVFVEI